jgi:hypothetical protein
LKKVKLGVGQIHNLFRICGLKRDLKNNIKDFRNDIKHTKLELELCKFGGLWKFGVKRPSSGFIIDS